MDVILRLVFIVFMSMFGMVLNHNLSTEAHTLHFLKEDLEIAVHDAALQINEEDLASGRIVFDQVKAMNTFRNSFEKNSRLEPTDYDLVDIYFFDESTISTFPHEFSADLIQFSDTLTGPTIVAFVETSRNAYYGGSNSEKYVQVASYTYKAKTNTIPNLENVVSGEPNAQGFSWPVPFTRNVTSNFSMRENPVTGVYELHAGTDIAEPGVLGTPVTPAMAGKVTYAGWIGGYGNIVVVNHGEGIETRYAHLNFINTNSGATVSPGDVVGTVGSTGNSTGPHLHFEIRIDGVPYDPMLFY